MAANQNDGVIDNLTLEDIRGLIMVADRVITPNHVLVLAEGAMKICGVPKIQDSMGTAMAATCGYAFTHAIQWLEDNGHPEAANEFQTHLREGVFAKDLPSDDEKN